MQFNTFFMNGHLKIYYQFLKASDKSGVRSKLIIKLYA